MVNELMSVESQNPTEFWKLIKKMQNWGRSKDDSSDNIDPIEWRNHFQKLLNETVITPQYQLDELSRLEGVPFFSELDVSITQNEIEKALKKLNKKAAPGPDNISGNLLYVGKDVLMPLLRLFFNKLFSQVNQPKLLTLNYLVTILKKGEAWDLDNYRGIAIGSILGKLFALILLNRLETWIKEAHPISPNQVGFKKGHRTSDHIFVLNTVVKRIVQVEKKRLYVAFVDFRKAYDKINRSLLFLKLQRLGVKGLFYQNLKAIYNDISYVIKVRGAICRPLKSIRQN